MNQKLTLILFFFGGSTQKDSESKFPAFYKLPAKGVVCVPLCVTCRVFLAVIQLASGPTLEEIVSLLVAARADLDRPSFRGSTAIQNLKAC